jgi:hypothetical protein
MTVAVPVVHNKALVILDVADELLHPDLLGNAIRGEFQTQAFKPPQWRISGSPTSFNQIALAN